VAGCERHRIVSFNYEVLVVLVVLVAASFIPTETVSFDRFDRFVVPTFRIAHCETVRLPPKPLRIPLPSFGHPAMAAASPPERKTFRIGALTGFLPLSDDIVSTRGQKLPALIQSRSTTNLSDASKFRQGNARGRGAHEGADDEESVHERWSGEEPHRHLQRLMSVSAEVLNSPQVRSMRLIGQNNPRYQW